MAVIVLGSYCTRTVRKLNGKGLTSRNGTLRTIAALHNQVNQALPASATLHIELRKWDVSGAREINRLSSVAVRDAPNLEAIPNRTNVRSMRAIRPGEQGTNGSPMQLARQGERIVAKGLAWLSPRIRTGCARHEARRPQVC
jgi:hypothetical protein